MKTKITLAIIFILSLTGLNAQQTKQTLNTKSTTIINQCDDLKAENDFLKKTLKINESIKLFEQDDIEIKLISAKGNIKTQIIKLEFLITNKIKIRRIVLDAFRDQYISIQGDLIPVTKGYTVYDLEMATEVPIKTAVEIGTILPENKILKLVTLKYLLGRYPSETTGTAEFRDINIEWK